MDLKVKQTKWMQLLVAILITTFFCFSSCGTKTQNAKTNLDWAGVYTGTLPGADSRIIVEITLAKEGTFKLSYQYQDKSDYTFTDTGTFKWKDNNTVELDNKEIPHYYLVAKNTLTQLDMTGKKIEGEHSSCYVLKKE